MFLLNILKKLFGRFAPVVNYNKKIRGRVAESYVIDSQLFSVKGWEGFIARNGKIYRHKRQAIKFGGGLIG